MDTTYKFREMIDFRDNYTKRDRRAADRAHQYRRDRGRHAAVRGRHPALLRPAQDARAARRARGGQLRRGVRRRQARRGTIAREGARVLAARREGSVGSEAAAAGALAAPEWPRPPRREHPRLPALELDRDRRLAVHPRGEDPGGPALFRQRARHRRARRIAHSRSSSRSFRSGLARSPRW